MKALNKFEKVSKEQLKSVGILALSLSVSILLIVFLIIPWWGEINKATSSLNAEKDRNQKLTQKEKLLSSTTQEKISKELADLTAALPNEKDIPALVSGVTRLSEEAGLQVEGMQINPGQVSTPSAKPEDDAVEFVLTLKGPPEALKGFLSSIEKAKRLMSVKDLTASIFGDGGLTVGLSIRAPYSGFAPPPEDVSTPLTDSTSDLERTLAEVNKFTDYTTPVAAGSVGKSNPFTE